MSDFTYEMNEKSKRYETYEWDNTWIDHANDISKKRVLYIGDSISCGIRRFATAQTNENILFDLFGSSRAVDNPFFKDAIRIFAKQEERRDAVLFNNGLHGGHLDSKTDYGYHYEEMIKFLMAEFENTPLAIVLTTHIADAENIKLVFERNEAAQEIADKYGLPVIDLYSVSRQAEGLLEEDGIHFLDEGYKLLADKIIQSVTEIVPALKYQI